MNNLGKLILVAFVIVILYAIITGYRGDARNAGDNYNKVMTGQKQLENKF